jgi:hypothetical protein
MVPELVFSFEYTLLESKKTATEKKGEKPFETEYAAEKPTTTNVDWKTSSAAINSDSSYVDVKIKSID